MEDSTRVQVGHSSGRASRRQRRQRRRRRRRRDARLLRSVATHPPNREPQKSIAKLEGKGTTERRGQRSTGGTINKLSTHRRTRLRRSAVVVFLPGMANAVVVSHCRVARPNGKEKSVGGCGRRWHRRVVSRYEIRVSRSEDGYYEQQTRPARIVVSLIRRSGTLRFNLEMYRRA